MIPNFSIDSLLLCTVVQFCNVLVYYSSDDPNIHLSPSERLIAETESLVEVNVKAIANLSKFPFPLLVTITLLRRRGRLSLP